MLSLFIMQSIERLTDKTIFFPPWLPSVHPPSGCSLFDQEQIIVFADNGPTSHNITVSYDVSYMCCSSRANPSGRLILYVRGHCWGLNHQTSSSTKKTLALIVAQMLGFCELFCQSGWVDYMVTIVNLCSRFLTLLSDANHRGVQWTLHSLY